MPRVNVPVNDIVRGGLIDPAEVGGDAVNNHDVVNDGKVIVVARNSSGVSTRDITFITQGTGPDQAAIADKTVTLAISEKRYFGPFPVGDWNADGKLHVDVAHADIKLQALRLP